MYSLAPSLSDYVAAAARRIKTILLSCLHAEGPGLIYVLRVVLRELTQLSSVKQESDL
jgi:hypothetical protein